MNEISGQLTSREKAENKWLFGSIPNEIILAHDWRKGVSHVGTIPAWLVEEPTVGVADWEIPVHLPSSSQHP